MLSNVTLIVNNELSGNAKDLAGESDTALGVTAARKLAAAQKRAARKAARRPRMFSETAYEYPTKGILKHRPLPKRSVSECIDDISQIMDELNIDLAEQDLIEESSNSGSDGDRPKKSVRFNEEVYETLFIASCLYDRRNFAKIHFSTRHHPPPNQCKKNFNGKKKDGKKGSSKNKNKKKTSESSEYTDTSSDDQSSGQEDNTSSTESIQCGGDSFIDPQSSLGNKMSKHNRKENREKKNVNLRLVQNCDNNNSDEILNYNNKLDDIRSSDHSVKNGSSKQTKGSEANEESEVSEKKPRRSTIDSGYDSTEEENVPWTTVRKGRKRWNSASA